MYRKTNIVRTSYQPSALSFELLVIRYQYILRPLRKCFLVLVLFFSTISFISAQQKDSAKASNWTYHLQLTVISQSHSGFNAKYSGNNSLADSVQVGAITVTSTLYLGRRLWKNAAAYFNPEIAGGAGLSSALGVAGALNGESYRTGVTSASVCIARAYIQQIIPLGRTGYEKVDDNENQIAGSIPSSHITLSAGKFSMSDFYDGNACSHDPRTQFFNWSLMSNGAWDYPANTKGYTMGLVAELIKPGWGIRLSSVAVPRIANNPPLQYNISKAHSETLGIEKKTGNKKHPGAVRLLVSNSYTKAPSYAEGIAAIADNDSTILKIISGKEENTGYGGRKFGLGMSADQEITDEITLFARAGWNDGQYATWAFTEIDQTASLGLSVKGTKWHRSNDVCGIAGVVNGISDAHRSFLADGGYGFIIGDGALNYGHEGIIETYYNIQLTTSLWLTFDYQFVNNPAYNKDRGPVSVFGMRGHFEF